MEDSSFKSNVKQKISGEFSDISLSLRRFNLSDIDDFMIWASDDNVTRFCTWDSYTSKEDGLDYFKRVVIPHPWFKAICLDNKAIGAISVSENLGNEKCRGLLGYVLAYKCWGKGITTRAVKMVANTIFDEWQHLQRLEAIVDVENLASQKVLLKAGFKKEAICLDNKPVGAISVTPNPGNCSKCRAVIGYAVVSDYWGKGIATRAVKMVADTIFTEWPHLDRVGVMVDIENLASQKVLHKAGFKVFCDVVMFSLLSTDPKI